MIQFDQVSLRRGGRVLFQKASMQLHPGWKIGLTGVNGAGKSTAIASGVLQRLDKQSRDDAPRAIVIVTDKVKTLEKLWKF